MKRIYRKAAGVVLAAGLIFSLTAPAEVGGVPLVRAAVQQKEGTVTAAQKETKKEKQEFKKELRKVKKAYESFIKSGEALEEYQGHTLKSVDNFYFTIKDVNQDKLPELILSDVNGENYVVFTYLEERVTNYDSNDNVDSNVALSYNKKRNVLIYKFQDEAGTVTDYSIQKCDPERMTKKLLLIRIKNKNGGGSTFKINSAPVTKDVFDQYLKRYCKKAETIKTVANTKKNREKLL